MATENCWRARKIQAELMKLGIRVGLATVSRHLPKNARDPTQQQRRMIQQLRETLPDEPIHRYLIDDNEERVHASTADTPIGRLVESRPSNRRQQSSDSRVSVAFATDIAGAKLLDGHASRGRSAQRTSRMNFENRQRKALPYRDALDAVPIESSSPENPWI